MNPCLGTVRPHLGGRAPRPRCKALLAALLALCAGCSKPSQPAPKEVVAYVALDDVFAEPLLAEYEKETGVHVKTVFDEEAAKSTGIATRLREEKERPQADVWWNNEPIETCLLKKEGLLAPYDSPSAKEIPQEWQDPDHEYTCIAARARVILYNTALVKPEEAPRSILDLVDSRWMGKVGIANPLFGSTHSHCACLFEAMGEEKAKWWFRALKKNRVRVLMANSTVRDQVASGELAMGLTDTDDAHEAVLDGKPVKVVYPDVSSLSTAQARRSGSPSAAAEPADGMGTLLLPNTVSLVKGCPHPEEGKRLIDWVLRPETEEKLASSRSVQMPVRPSVKVPPGFVGIGDLHPMKADFAKAAERLPAVYEFLEQEFLH